MRVVVMTIEEKRSRMLCHRCWLLGKKTLATKMIENTGTLHITGYEDVINKGLQLGICKECLVSLDLVKGQREERSHG